VQRDYHLLGSLTLVEKTYNGKNHEQLRYLMQGAGSNDRGDHGNNDRGDHGSNDRGDDGSNDRGDDGSNDRGDDRSDDRDDDRSDDRDDGIDGIGHGAFA